MDYERVEQDAGRVAQSLRLAGVKRGDHVALFLANCPELVLSYYACFKIGAVALPLNNRYKGAEIAYAVGQAGATVLIAQDHLFPEVANVRFQLTNLASKAITWWVRARLPGCAPFLSCWTATGDIGQILVASRAYIRP
jgi:acyl-CoA synthetase (AMP-forming)/AMP-acid ligase II